MATGRPYSSTNASTSSTPLTGSAVPGASGAPIFSAMCRAVVLSPSAAIASGDGPIQVDAGVDDGLRELGVLRQEAVAGVHRVGAGLLERRR